MGYRFSLKALRSARIWKHSWVVLAVAFAAGTVIQASALVMNAPQANRATQASATSTLVAIPALRSRKLDPTPSPSAKAPSAAATTAARSTAAPAPAPPRPAPAPFAFEAGVNVLVYGNDPAFATKSAAQLDHLAQLHVNSVSFVFPIYQANWTASSVYADPIWTPSSANIRLFIRAAHQRHMRVLLRPLMDENSLHPAGKWRGQIAPTSVGAWFASYDNLVLGYAQIAQAEHAEILDIGTEFDSLQGYSQQWINLVNAVRRVYSGQLTYSANWAIWYPSFGWALDFLSVDAFFPLNAPINATQGQLAAAWSQWVARANTFAHNFSKQVVFTELGTTSQAGSFQSPWNWNQGTGLSLETQRLYYAAACQALKSRISGIYWWEYLLGPLPSPATDQTYDPQGKPADGEIARCYS